MTSLQQVMKTIRYAMLEGSLIYHLVDSFSSETFCAISISISKDVYDEQPTSHYLCQNCVRELIELCGLS